jgi:hypothetical protein
MGILDQPASAVIAALRGAANGIASLVGGKVPLGQIPTADIAASADLTSAFGTAINAQRGVPDGFAALDEEARVRGENLPVALSDSALRAVFGSVTLLTAFGAAGDGVTNDTAAWNAAVAAVPAGGTLFIPYGTYVLPDVSVQRSDIDIAGSGTIKGRITFGTAGVTTDFKGHGIFGVRFERTGPTGDLSFAAIRWVNAKRHVVAGCWFYNMSSAIYSVSESGQDCADNIVRDNVYDNVQCLFRGITGSGAVWRSHADLSFTGNTGKARLTHILIDSCDGVKVYSNRMFFSGWDKADATKQRHIDILYSDWVEIIGNALFEAGLDSIRLIDPGHFEIEDNHIAWPGQRLAGDGINIVLGQGVAGDATAPARTFTYGTIGGGTISQFTRNAISFYGTGLISHVKIRPISIERSSGAPQQYYGAPALPTPYRVWIESTITALTPQLPPYDGDNGTLLPDNFRGRLLATDRWIHQRSKETALMSRDQTVTGTAAIFSVTDLNAQSSASTAIDGEIKVDARNAGTLAKTAVYKLLICNSPDGTKSCVVLGSGGRTSGAAANDPSFTWDLFHTGSVFQLRATPVGSTSGAFSFTAKAEGNMLLG